jgi:hypothetical protein
MIIIALFRSGGVALRSLSIPTKMIEIGEGAFQLSALTSLVIPTGVTFIDQVSRISVIVLK